MAEEFSPVYFLYLSVSLFSCGLRNISCMHKSESVQIFLLFTSCLDIAFTFNCVSHLYTSGRIQFLSHNSSDKYALISLPNNKWRNKRESIGPWFYCTLLKFFFCLLWRKLIWIHRYYPLFIFFFPTDGNIQRGCGRTELNLLLCLRTFKLVFEQKENIFICSC